MREKRTIGGMWRRGGGEDEEDGRGMMSACYARQPPRRVHTAGHARAAPGSSGSTASCGCSH
eukprot:12416097-Karenia_brevis.AAC.1